MHNKIVFAAQACQWLPAAVFACLLLAPITQAGAETSRPVKTTPLADLAMYPQKSAPATVVSLNNTLVSAQIEARLEDMSVKVGEVVEAGSLLARLDCTYYHLAAQRMQARTASLQASIRLAQRRLERTRKLVRTQSASEELLDQREAELAVLHADHDAASAGLKEAQTDISHCVIKSPYRSVITERISSIGDFARVGTNLFRIVDYEQLEVSAQIPVGDIDQVNQVTELHFEDTTGHYPVTIRTTVPAINTRSRNQEVRLLFDNEKALPGAAGQLSWRAELPHVPGKLLVRRGDNFGVFVVERGQARFNVVHDAQPGRPVRIDLPPDTLLITEGQYILQDKQVITVLP